MRLTLISVGKDRADPAAPLVVDYISRISKFLPCESIVLRQERGDRLTAQIFKKTEKHQILVALDEKGESCSSPDFAELMASWMNQGYSGVAFVIGGADGLPAEVARRADLLLSLSKMTLPHRLARLFLAEQMYRALCILRGTPYQK